MKYTVSKNIAASPEVIWSILTNAGAYPTWNTPVTQVDGKIAANERIRLYTKLSPKRAFALQVTTFSPSKLMTWTGGMPLGLFKGVRDYLLTPRLDGTTDFTMTETFSGLLLKLIAKSLPDLAPSFEETAMGLKNAAESLTTQKLKL